MLAYRYSSNDTLRSSAPLRFSAGLHMIPHPEKAAKGGEDAAYFSEKLLVVADGVGGWAEQGVDPARYSRALVRTVKEFFPMNEEKYLANIAELVSASAKHVKEPGSSTLVVAALKESGDLATANFGDSGYLIFRPDGQGSLKTLFESKEMVHSFNFPFQLGLTGDDPSKAEINSHKLQKGDFVVLATDGVLDNLDKIEIRKIVSSASNDPKVDSKEIAKLIANSAFKASQDTENITPFAEAARKAGMYYKGGKPDDITVVVGRVE